ncbi:MAG: ABC transporter permease [Alphaproteobacteria bacterium]
MFDFSPLTKRRIHNFKANKRGYISLVVFMILALLSCLAELIANDKPLFIRYQHHNYFPILSDYYDSDFGGDFEAAVDYKDPFIINNINQNGVIIWTPIKYSYDTINFDLEKPAPSAPSLKHLLGTDDLGRDVLARLIYGFRISIIFGLVLTLLSTLIGVFAGAVQGYFGGKIDLVLQRLIEIWDSLPQLFILIIISSILVPGFWTLLLIILMFRWTSLVGVVRAEFLRGRNFDYVRAARALGVSDTKIIIKHVLPNAMIATITFMPFILSAAITSLTALDFLGLGLPSGSPSLGDLLRQGKENLEAPWLGLTGFFSLAVMLTLLVFIGEAVRDAFDPRKNNA